MPTSAKHVTPRFSSDMRRISCVEPIYRYIEHSVQQAPHIRLVMTVVSCISHRFHPRTSAILDSERQITDGLRRGKAWRDIPTIRTRQDVSLATEPHAEVPFSIVSPFHIVLFSLHSAYYWTTTITVEEIAYELLASRIISKQQPQYRLPKPSQ